MQRLPIGIEDFETIRTEGYYYVDKTRLIEELLTRGGFVTLFTRPRRFGKTLNMSMLKAFFELGQRADLFDGLMITEHRELCRMYQGQFPVIFLSLKDIDGQNYEEARCRAAEIIKREAARFYFLETSEQLNHRERLEYGNLADGTADPASALRSLTELLYRHFQKKVVVLIDEYDVPLDRAFQHGYYDEMVLLIRQMLGSALKTNPCLQMAVLTGCLRISKESIFTGLNHFQVSGISDGKYDENFGFTDAEVQQLLSAYHMEAHEGQIKEWYDGYQFGRRDVYCPWDVINFLNDLCFDDNAEPQDYWINTSGNEIVQHLIQCSDRSTKEQIEELIRGGMVQKAIRQDLTYSEIGADSENLWSVLYMTGYLTVHGKAEDGTCFLQIPNREIRDIFILKVKEWFQNRLQNQTDGLRIFAEALQNGHAERLETELNAILAGSISILDAKAKNGRKESFYHGMLLGLLRSQRDWIVRSNIEAGEGYSDLIIMLPERNCGIVIEVKYADSVKALDQAADNALRQIEERHYTDYFVNEGIETVMQYGISFFKKKCRVKVN